MKLNEMEKTLNKVAQGKTIAATKIEHGRCKLIFEDLSFVEFYVHLPFGRSLASNPSATLGARWGKEDFENSSSN